MRSRSADLVAILTLAMLPTLAPPAVAAPPVGWHNDGNALCGAAGRQYAPAAISDDAGGMIVLWLDQRRGPGYDDLYAQRVNASAEIAAGWPDDGALVTSVAPGRPLVTRDGAGGALVLWSRNGAIRALHLLADGTLPAGSDPAGRVVASGIGGPSWSGFTACPDGAGGAYVLWLDFDFSSEHLRLARVNADGLPVAGWETPFELWSNYWGFGGFVGFALASPPTGGAIVAFSIFSEEPVGGRYYGRARKLGGDGTLLWTQDLNAQLGVSAVGAVQLLADDADGTLVRLAQGTANHLDGSGAAGWPVSPSVTSFPMVAGDGSGGLFSLEFSSQTPTVHRIGATGSLPFGWTASGVPLSSAFNLSAYDVEPVPGGVMLAWSDAPAGDIRATAVTVDGAFGAGWSAGGNLLCQANGTQTERTLVPLGINAALVAWTDTRRDDGDIYANRATGSEPLGVPVATAVPGLRWVGEVAGGAAVRVAGTIAEPGEARLELCDVAGRMIHRETFAAAPGPFERTLSPGRLARGVYWVRLESGGRRASARFLRLE